ncbi:MAG: DUF2911 domain-containing protein [Acidobacteria bacterium]|nr:MAG: DUF2911 domain-containing protein [Acidobacteriota bacterium]REK04549.1 MAG: DUF2911 domain-containing protein [Acidobacteriota bacterium]
MAESLSVVALGALLTLAPVALGQEASLEPLESPLAELSQVVGLRPVVIRYSSPGVKGREIWGALVPFGERWRAGANAKTTFTFPEHVELGGRSLPAGTYGFYVVPESSERWVLVWNRAWEGSPNEFDPEQDALRLEVEAREAPFRERLQYSIENFTDWPPFEADLVLHWERRRAVVRMVFPEVRGWTPPG